MNNYFSHDSNARNSDKLIHLRMKYSAEGYGIYFMILERLREEPEYMSVKDYNMLAFDLRVDSAKVKSVIEDFGLFVFTDDGKYFYSEGFKKRMEKKDETRAKLSDAGKKGNVKRWSRNQDAISTQSLPDLHPIATQSQEKERKEKDNNKESTNVDEKENPPEKSDFEKFNCWIRDNVPNILKIQKQITEDQFLKLKEKYSYKQIIEILQCMGNYKDAPKKYIDVYLTFLKWAKKEYGSYCTTT